MTILPFPSLTIEPLEQQWLDTAARFLYANWHQVYDPYLPDKLIEQRTLAYFTGNLQKRFDNCFIARLGEQLVGVVISSANCIDDIWVSKKLISRIQSQLKSRGFDSVQVGCERFNTEAIAFFQALNWRILGSEPVTIIPGHQCEVLVFGTKL